MSKEALETVSAPAVSAPAVSAPESAPQGESFVDSAMSMLSEYQKGAEAPAPVAETPTEVTTPESTAPTTDSGEAPTEKVIGNMDDEEGRSAEEDISRETSQMPSQQKAAFTKLRYELRDKNRQLRAATEKQTPTEEGKAVDPELAQEVERLRQENAATKEKLSKFDQEFLASRIELTDEFQENIVKPRTNIAVSIGEIAERYDGVESELVIKAVKSGDGNLIDRATADMSEYDRYQFYKLVGEYQEVSRLEQGMRENARETLDKVSNSRRAQQEQQTSKERGEWTEALDKTWNRVVEAFPVLSPIDGNDAWNKQVERVKAFATPDRYAKLTTSEKAETLYRAGAFPVLVSELEQSRAEVKEMKQRMTKYAGATPSVSTAGGGTGTVEIGGVPVDSNTDMAGAMAAMFKKAGIR